MPMKIDHVGLGAKLADTGDIVGKLIVAASSAYPLKNPIISRLRKLKADLEELRNKLDGIYHSEVSHAEFEQLKHPYYPEAHFGRSRPDIGIAEYRPRHGNRKQRFSREEKNIVFTRLAEIGECLAIVQRAMSVYGKQKMASEALQVAENSLQKATAAFKSV